MREICKNAEKFLKTDRGKKPHPASGLPNWIFGYDMNTGDHSRQEARRSASCPSSWRNRHPCPEPDQQKPMRNDGEWFTTAKEQPGDNLIKHERDANGNVIRRSNIRYSCDEFPPATW